MGEDERERDGEGRRKEETRRGCGEKEEKVSTGARGEGKIVEKRGKANKGVG